MRRAPLLLLCGLAAALAMAQLLRLAAWYEATVGLSTLPDDELGVPVFDCNGNGVEDSVDIGIGSSYDANQNGLPDECEAAATPFSCSYPAAAPCSKVGPAAGCADSLGADGLRCVGVASYRYLLAVTNTEVTAIHTGPLTCASSTSATEAPSAPFTP